MKIIPIIFLFFISSAWAVKWKSSTIPDPKKNGTLHQWVSNPDKVLSRTEELKLNQLISNIDDSGDLQFGVVIVKKLGQGIEEFSTQTFNRWSIGQKDTNRGLLIVLAVEDRKQRIEVGIGLESKVPNQTAKEILDNTMAPLNRQGKFYESIKAGIKQLNDLIYSSPVPTHQSFPISQRPIQDEMYIVFVGAAFLGFVYIILALVFKITFIEIALGFIFFSFCLGGYYVALVVIQPKANVENWIYYLYGATILTFNALVLLVGRGYLSKIKNMGETRDEKFNRLGYAMDPLVRSLIPIGWPASLFFLNDSSHLREQIRRHDLICQCQTTLTHRANVIPRTRESEFLKTERIQEESIGSVDNDVWVCSSCNQVSVFRYIMPNVHYKDCPSCKLLGIHISSQVISSATEYSTGLREITHNCLICKYKNVETEIIPQIHRSTSNSSSGGGSSGGSSWGGGSSRGGGSSGSW